jgi:hypothetical protein
MSLELSRLSPGQKVVLVVIAAPVLLFTLGVAGLQVTWFPHDVAVAVVLLAAVTPLFLVLVGRIYGLRREQGVTDGSISWLAVRQRWYLAIAGACAFVVGALLLVPTERSTLGLKIAGVAALVWGALSVWTAVLAFRKKRMSRHDSPRRSSPPDR